MKDWSDLRSERSSARQNFTGGEDTPLGVALGFTDCRLYSHTEFQIRE